MQPIPFKAVWEGTSSLWQTYQELVQRLEAKTSYVVHLGEQRDALTTLRGPQPNTILLQHLHSFHDPLDVQIEKEMEKERAGVKVLLESFKDLVDRARHLERSLMGPLRQLPYATPSKHYFQRNSPTLLAAFSDTLQSIEKEISEMKELLVDLLSRSDELAMLDWFSSRHTNTVADKLARLELQVQGHLLMTNS